MFLLLIHFLAFMIISHQSSYAKHVQDLCPQSSCGAIHNISHPFRLRSDPENCGDQRYNLSCEDNQTVLYDGLRRFNVLAINYNNFTIRVVEPDVQKGNCSSLPQQSFINNQDFLMSRNAYKTAIIMYGPQGEKDSDVIYLFTRAMFVSCENPVKSRLYIDTTPCINASAGTSLESERRYHYALLSVQSDMFVTEFEDSCRVELVTPINLNQSNGEEYYRNVSYADIHDSLAFGFELSWLQSFHKWGSCYIDQYNKPQCVSSCADLVGPLQCFGWKIQEFYYHYSTQVRVFAWLLGTKLVLGAICGIAFLIFKWKRRHLSMYDCIEEFLQSQNNLMPIRYSYSDIKSMTKGFGDKLGEGGYGSVYKGKLRSGRFVAIKMLGKSKANGQDFINEVATIGRIHHVNVVRLIGFCVDKSRRALVYDFMPNGSLDKHIFSQQGIDSLINCAKMFEISLGVARGIDYLHQGCEIRILHFDIKPHNILLDENFVPKISDFGLARLCPVSDEDVCLTAARGTLGYIAPELFYKNIGGVSYKADVYSFGMLLMEMASRRKNMNPAAENSTQAHFPSWVSERIHNGENIDLGFYCEEESKIVKKMMIVALWCVQLKPCDRPSMNKVVEMLEEELECLQTPPTKFSFCSYDWKEDNTEDSSYPLFSSTLSEDMSARLIPNTDE